MVRDAVTVTVGIDASVEVVWRFLTVARTAWWPDLRFEASVGSPLVETWVEEGRLVSATGKVTRCDEPYLLAFSWIEEDWDHPLDVVVELVVHGQSTSVAVTESGFSLARTPHSLFTEHEQGWRHHLARLKRTSEGETVAVDAE